MQWLRNQRLRLQLEVKLHRPVRLAVGLMALGEIVHEVNLLLKVGHEGTAVSLITQAVPLVQLTTLEGNAESVLNEAK